LVSHLRRVSPLRGEWDVTEEKYRRYAGVEKVAFVDEALAKRDK
jgi:hypothetical protein